MKAKEELYFRRGYYCAVATVIRQHGQNTVAEDLLKEMGRLDFRGIDPFDLEVLEPVALVLIGRGADAPLR